MSTGSTFRSHHPNRRSIEINHTSSSPLVGRRTVDRLDSTSTTSSTSSNLSHSYDEQMSSSLNSARRVPPITPPCERISPKSSLAAQSLDGSHQLEPRSQTNQIPQASEIESPSDSQRVGTTLKKGRKRPSAGKSKLSTRKRLELPVQGYLPTPRNNFENQQRAVSDPVLPRPLRYEPPWDLDRLQLPGRYESQNSNLEVRIEGKVDQDLASMSLNENEADNGTNQYDPEIFEDDTGKDDESYPFSDAGTSVQHECVSDHSLGPETSPFVPFSCVKGQPTVRRHRGKRSNNAAIRKLLLKRDDKGADRGWVYIAQSVEHGPGKLKIGMTKETPDERIEKLQECKLELREISGQDQNPFHHFQLLEKIIFLELRDQRLKLVCRHSGGRVHELTEWFEVDRKAALRVLDIWRDWILIQKPFDHCGKLNAYWKWRVEELEACIADVNWEAWTQPPTWSYYVFLMKAHFSHSRKDIRFYVTGSLLTLLSFMGRGGKEAIWAVFFLLLL